MNRSIWISGCAVFAILLLPLLGAAQPTDDLFGSSESAAEENPFSETPPATPSAIDRSILAATPNQPAEQATSNNEFCQCVGAENSPSVAKIEQALRAQLKSSGLEFTDTPLEEVVGFIQESYGIPVQLDTTALEEIGIDPQEPVTVSLHGISLRSALRLMFKQLQLTYIIQDEVLIITTPESAESELLTCVYDVRDLMAGPKDVGGADALIDTIVKCISTETWAENGGGEAAIEFLKPGLLVIAQTRAVHEEVRGLLETIRNVQKQAPAAAHVEKSAAAQPDPNELVTRPYFLSLGQPADPEEVRLQIKNLITTALPDEKWEGRLSNGQPVLLTVLPDRVVLRHKPAVHEKVETLLSDSGVASPPARGVAGRGGGLGGAGGSFGSGGFGGGGGGFFRPRPAAAK
jgi:hypothetical protein